MEFLKQLFCKHKYSYVGDADCTFETDSGQIVEMPAFFHECKKCGKRIVLKNEDCFYTKTFLNQIKLWQKRQIEFNFEKESEE